MYIAVFHVFLFSLPAIISEIQYNSLLLEVGGTFRVLVLEERSLD